MVSIQSPRTGINIVTRSFESFDIVQVQMPKRFLVDVNMNFTEISRRIQLLCDELLAATEAVQELASEEFQELASEEFQDDGPIWPQPLHNLIYRYIRDNPGCTTAEMAKALEAELTVAPHRRSSSKINSVINDINRKEVHIVGTRMAGSNRNTWALARRETI